MARPIEDWGYYQPPPPPPPRDEWLPYPPPQPRPGRPPITLDEAPWTAPPLPPERSPWATPATDIADAAREFFAREEENRLARGRLLGRDEGDRARWAAFQTAYAPRAGQATVLSAAPSWPGAPQTTTQGGYFAAPISNGTGPLAGLTAAELEAERRRQYQKANIGAGGTAGYATTAGPAAQSQAAVGPGDWYSQGPLPGEEAWWAAFAKEHNGQTPADFYHGNVGQARADREWGRDYAEAHPMLAGLPPWQREAVMDAAYKDKAWWTRLVEGQHEVRWDIDPRTGQYMVQRGPSPWDLDKWASAQGGWWRGWPAPAPTAPAGTTTPAGTTPTTPNPPAVYSGGT